MSVNVFRNKFSEDIFNYKYRHEGCENWEKLAAVLVEDVCREWMTADEKETLTQAVATMKFIPGGRYIYYAGRPIKAFNNCYLLRAESDTREDWAMLSWKAESCLATGGGIGVDYSIYRPKGTPLKRTGGEASGPVSKMRMINEIGREVMQGGSRRSAIYASLNWQHPDIKTFLYAKDWHSMKVPGTDKTVWDCKVADFNYPAPLDMTNISANYDDAWLNLPDRHKNEVFLINCRQAMETGEPGWSFNFGDKQNETLRNAPVTAETMILTDSGYRPVAELIGVPATVWTGKQWAPDVVFKETHSDATIVRVAFTGGRAIRCDISHPFLVERYAGAGEKRHLISVDRIPAEQLQPGDILHVSLPEATDPVARNVDSYTLGYLYGDGSFCQANSAEITFCTEDKKACVSIISEASRLSSITHKDGRGYTRAYFKVDHEYFGEREKDEFPVELFSASTEEQASFVAGLFDSDGNWDASQRRIRLSSNHEGFLRDTARLLEQLGILAGVNRNGRSTYGKKQTYSLVVMGDYVKQFAKLVPTERLKIDVGNWEPYRSSTIKVESVVADGNEYVYCADVKVDEHSFMAEGVIISNCTEVTSEDDSDVCNLGSLNMSRIETAEEFRQIVELATKFLICGTMVAHLPYDKVHEVRAKNRRLGLGLMGMHEWLVQRGSRYEVTDSLHKWLGIYRDESDAVAKSFSAHLSISEPVAKRAIAPTGSIGILAGTTTGIEPVFAVAYKRRYLKNGTQWHYQYVVDSAAKDLIERYGVDPSKIESAIDLAKDYERRLKFQADTQDYVDQSISSTINMPSWGSELNNEDKIDDFALTLSKYAPRLRGFTVYPDGARGGQPLVSVDYDEAVKQQGVEYLEHDVCVIGGKGGTCGS